MSKTAVLERFAYAPDGTFGRLRLPDGWSCLTVERPWCANRASVSCIPDGLYRLQRRRSPVVERSSGGEFQVGWEVTGVPQRSLIMIHPGNWPHKFEGCIGVGKRYAVMQGANGVTQSRETFSELMGRLDGLEWQLDIRPYIMEWP